MLEGEDKILTGQATQDALGDRSSFVKGWEPLPHSDTLPQVPCTCHPAGFRVMPLVRLCGPDEGQS